ncbi:hypothetical protein GCM10023191_024920 [Actinoallomurus oryzae]|uniref:ESAT-6-like protein n=1 Tax=Actinoallomurus oryzae TaxID=502180 RepID=A0ABP8PRX0_9ACTN
MGAISDGSFFVNHAGFNEAADSLQQESKNIQQVLDELTANLRPLVETWVGEAKDAYQIAQTNWNSAVTDMEGTLIRAYHASQEIHNNYIVADLQGSYSFQGLS